MKAYKSKTIVNFQIIFQVISALTLPVCLINQTYAQNTIPKFNLNIIKHDAFRWITLESNKDSQNLVNFLFLPLFALNISVDLEEKEEMNRLLIKRINNVIVSNQRVLPVIKNNFFDYVVCAFVLFEMGFQDNKFKKVSQILLNKYSLDELFPTDKNKIFSVDHTTKLILLYMLEKMESLPFGSSSYFINIYRGKYDVIFQEISEYRLKQILYFISHVIFTQSNLGITNVPVRSVTLEKKILLAFVKEPDIFHDNDLWPEIYLALSLIEGCPSSTYSSKFISIIQNQDTDGSWMNSSLIDTLRFHTTSAIYLSALGYQRCESMK